MRKPDRSYVIFPLLLVPVLIFIVILKYCLKIDEALIPLYLTVSIGLLGYFVIHRLEIDRKTREKKLEACLKLMKSLRLFLNEPYYLKAKSKKKIREYRDNFIDAQYSFALLISNESNILLQELIHAYSTFMTISSRKKAGKELERVQNEFKLAQNLFVNSLRDEFSIEGDINFETFAITTPEEP